MYIFKLPLYEYHHFMRWNAIFYHFKKTHGIKVGVIVPYEGACFMTCADVLITCNYEVAERNGINHTQLIKSVPLNSYNEYCDFFTRGKEIAKQIYPDAIFINTNWIRIVDEKGKEHFPEYSLKSGVVGPDLTRDFNYVGDWLRDGNIYKPIESSFTKMKDKYGHLFIDKTYLFASRYLLNKVPQNNSSPEQLLMFLNKALEAGLRIINFGVYPPQHFDILHENYFEIHDPTIDNDDMISLAYLGNGKISSGWSGSVIIDVCGNIDLFTLTTETSGAWGSTPCSTLTKSFVQDISRNGIDEMIEILLKHKRKGPNEFQEKTSKIFLID